MKDREKVAQILEYYPIYFHFDSQERDFPIDERRNNVEFLMRKYNHLKDKQDQKVKGSTESVADKEFMKMMEEFSGKFTDNVKFEDDRFTGLKKDEDLDAMNLYVHNYSLKNLLKHGGDQVSELIENLKAEFGDKDVLLLDKDDLRRIYETGLKFQIESIDIGHGHLTPRNLQSCEELSDRVARGDECGVAIDRNIKHKPPLYYNLQKSDDGKKFVMQFGLTYPVNEGIKFPVWVQPLVKGFVEIVEKFSPKLYKKIKGTKNGKIGYHLEDRELGSYEGRIENGKFVVDNVMLTGHGPKACDVKKYGDKQKKTDVYVGVGGHPNYFHSTGKSNILRKLERIPILGIGAMIKRFVKDHGDFCDGKGEVLKFGQGSNDQLRDWAGDSMLRVM